VTARKRLLERNGLGSGEKMPIVIKSSKSYIANPWTDKSRKSIRRPE
jgi:hypothetical protein